MLEIQERVNTNTTNVCELTYDYPYILCQNASLVVGKEYQLNFTVFNQWAMRMSEIHLFLNGVSVYNHTTLNQLNRSTASFNFVASIDNTQICFDYLLSPSWPFHDIGPCLDNITI